MGDFYRLHNMRLIFQMSGQVMLGHSPGLVLQQDDPDKLLFITSTSSHQSI